MFDTIHGHALDSFRFTECLRHLHIEASPLHWVTPDAAPTLYIHGTNDKYVAHEQAVWLIDRLSASDVEAKLLTIEGGDHGFGKSTPEVKTQIESAIFEFFGKHLK